MASNHHKPKEIVAKLGQVEVPFGRGVARIDAIREISIADQTSYHWRKNRAISRHRRFDPAFEQPIKKMIEENPSFGYRTVAWLLGFNSEPRSAPPVQAPRRAIMRQVFQLKGWQVRKRPVGALQVMH